ncbi:Hypothetical predicted protein [Mytilus galloprovincialis]|uniref:Uncharacterized protein n=1 Tax=Mytilus galloprovincialis TaxID=29158 RepID=A0A8B6FSY1_MYTGA|nr:Hypothetical predicted protein [Mytilus galloprovincialis]
MSDEFTAYCKLKLDKDLKPAISNALSPHLHKDFLSRGEISLTLEIKNNFISEIHKTKTKFSDYKYIEILNTQISTFQLKGTDRLEERLKKTAERVSYQYKTKFRCGRKRSSFNEGITKIAVYDSELQDVTSLSYRLSKFEEDKIELSIRCKELHKQLLSEEKQRSRGNADYQKLETITEKLKRENDSLHKCLDLLEKHHISSVGGKPVGDLGKSQRYAKMQTLKTQSAKALWFAETYGLTPKNLVFETEHGEDINIRFGEQTESQSENDEIRLKEILFLLDKFAISDQAYHEIAMKTNDLPKFYLIKNCRDKFNEGIQLERTPGNVPGAFLNFRSEVENAIKQKFNDVPTDDAQKKVRIKVSGDGTKVSRISNYVVMSFSLIDDETSLSSLHQKKLWRS